MAANDIALFLTTAPNTEVAATLARELVKLRLAACVNLLPAVRSIYQWEGKLTDEPEVQLIIKSQVTLEPKLIDWLANHHPYDEPELLMLPVAGGSPGYLAWVADMTR